MRSAFFSVAFSKGRELTFSHQSFGGSYANLLAKSNRSALALVDLVVTHFPCYDDRTTYPASGSRDIVIRKRAQILVAETWAAFDGKGPGRFEDINELTMFADYRSVPSHNLSLRARVLTLLRSIQRSTNPPLPPDPHLLPPPHLPPSLARRPPQRQPRRSRDPLSEHRRRRRNSPRDGSSGERVGQKGRQASERRVVGLFVVGSRSSGGSKRERGAAASSDKKRLLLKHSKG